MPLIHQWHFLQKIVQEKKVKLSSAAEKEKVLLQEAIDENQQAIERLEFRESLGDCFATKNESDMPADLVWETGMDEPNMGDPL